ncbi:VC0807 family protein [Sciscionella sediminilitoris]|uniref:VC0807 family protein n=1 Tax=Sciscionella sediminilitoris TaxID=1445613 RepID=UPI000692588B|nr:VC0807 family protein [Sciscionella sp. SE31]
MTTTRTTAAPPQQSGRQTLINLVTDLILPVVLYYVLRSTGMGIYASLLISAAIPAAIAIVRLIRTRHIDGLAVYAVTVMVLGAIVSLIAGSPRFMLAREGWLTGFTGLWFLISVGFGRRPLAFLYSRPFLEGRLTRRGVPGDWDQLWTQLPGFRRIWRIATVMWGIGLLGDAVLRVLMAYTLPVDTVPALSTPLYTVTSVVLLFATNIYYRFAGLFDGRSALYASFRDPGEQSAADHG